MAYRYLERALLFEPNSPELFLCLGNLYYEADEHAEAAHHYQAVLAVRPEWSAAQKNLALAYEKLGDVASARSSWEELSNHPTLGDEARRHLFELGE